MKNFLLLFCFALCANISYSQFKVTSDGVNHALNATLVVGEDAGTANASVNVGEFRTGSGNAGFDMYTQPGNSWQVRFLARSNGQSVFRHAGADDLAFRTDLASSSVLLRPGNTTILEASQTGVNINGTATLNGGTAITSDKRLKNNVVTFDLGLETVMQLNPVEYNYTGEFNTSTERSFVGLVAQELQKVAPGFVSDHNHKIYDEEGVVVDEQTFLKIHDSELKYILVNAIQQQQELIAAQAERIATLENTVLNGTGSNEIKNNTTINLTGYDLAELGQNAPNPFNGSTLVKYVVPTDANSAQIAVFGQSGQLLKTLDIDHVGEGTLNINADNLPSGTYSYQLIVDGRNVKTNKMVIAQ